MAAVKQLKQHLKPTDVVVVICHDHGSRYIGKVYSDDWMRMKGFLESNQAPTVSGGRKGQPVEDTSTYQPSESAVRPLILGDWYKKMDFYVRLLRGWVVS